MNIKQKLTSFFLASVVSISLIASCAAQGIRNIPIHFHIHPDETVSTQQLDAQIAKLNQIFTVQGTPFRFQRVSTDDIPRHLGGLGDLNVLVVYLKEFYGLTVYSPAEATRDPHHDGIFLDPSSLPSSKERGSGFILAHEIGHWLGLDHNYITRDNCMNDVVPSVRTFTCAFTNDQKSQMLREFDQFRLTR